MGDAEVLAGLNRRGIELTAEVDHLCVRMQLDVRENSSFRPAALPRTDPDPRA